MVLGKYLKNSIKPPKKNDFFIPYLDGLRRTCGEVFSHNRSRFSLFSDVLFGLFSVFIGIGVTVALTVAFRTYIVGFIGLVLGYLITNGILLTITSLLLLVCTVVISFFITIELVVPQIAKVLYLHLFIVGRWDFLK